MSHFREIIETTAAPEHSGIGPVEPRSLSERIPEASSLFSIRPGCAWTPTTHGLWKQEIVA
ncbi:MAG: hypothetical protein CME06_10045 [Gemmatimonadetes bacterium]|nr:hypothetical protein [Gemmatimonadota bacterium]